MKKQLIIFPFLLAAIITGSFANRVNTDGTQPYASFYSAPDTVLNNLMIKVVPFDLAIIPPSSGVQFYKDGLVFLSSSKSKGGMIADHISFGKVDSHFAVLKDSVLDNAQILPSKAGMSVPSEATTFSSDYKTMYFTSYSKADGREKIYMATFSDGPAGGWSVDPNPLSFCSDKSAYTHPALSADGNLMVFASDRPGSIGGMDLYVSLEKDGKWSDPVNLGDAVNSSFNELYPFLDSDNNLFFSSDNSQGFGGYDIYVCKFRSNTWEKPINLSLPVNTPLDDVAFKIDNEGGSFGFYTRKQKDGKSGVQLYKVDMNLSGQSSILTLSQYFTRPDMSQMVILALEPAVQATDNTTQPAARGRGETARARESIVYRVQFLTSFNPKTRSQITVGGKAYSVYEYLYSGAYRLCIGEFSTLAQALELQKTLINDDYPNASVVAFRNNVLQLDPELLRVQTTDVKPVADAVKPSDRVADSMALAREKARVADSLALAKAKAEVKKPDPVKTAATQTADQKVVAAKPATETATPAKQDVIIYRVQILANAKPKGSVEIPVKTEKYKSYEYFYAGSYRTCIGEFSTLNPAKALQNLCRQAGYPQAFVVAFKNNVRSTDPALFK
jgi:hypothetical protein